MKKSYIFFVVIFSNLFYSQNFEYERTWGTYFGATPGEIGSLRQGIIFDPQKNLYLRGSIKNYWQNSSSSYFNQFLLGGGSSYLASSQIGASSSFEACISPFGMPFYYGYYRMGDSALLEEIDSQGNKYFIIYSSTPSIQATSGVYLSADPQPSSAYKVLLAKYSPSGFLIWATYLPPQGRDITLETDNVGNVYVSSYTNMTQNIGTNGVLQENFDGGNSQLNGYLIKLSPSGQRIWGTYMPCIANHSMQYYNGSLYMITGMNSNPTLNTMATPGAFQTSKSYDSITKMDAGNGTRQWGTYYGPPTGSNSSVHFINLRVNETGVYITGTNYDNSGVNFFGTPSSYKQYATGGSDLVLSKFSLSGNREWSTYFGSPRMDSNEFDNVLALNGNEIYITGTSYGMGNIPTTPDSYQPAPELSTHTSCNFYFAKFNSSGSLLWSSYYGGSSYHENPFNYTNTLMPINVAFDNNVLYLFGSTNSNNGYTTGGAFMPVRNPANTNDLTCFIARFDPKNLGTAENDVAKDLVLYDNPNNGQFGLQGTVLTKKNCIMKLYDAAGRLINKQKLSNARKQNFEMQSILQKGSYMIEVCDDKTPVKTFKMIVK